MAPKSFPPPDVRHASLDAPGTKQVVPAILKDMYWNPEELPMFVHVPAYEKLPRWFIPSKKLSYKPPLMHYGWCADFDALLEMAEGRGFIRWHEYLDYEVDDADYDAYDKGMDPPLALIHKMDNQGTIGLLLETVARELAPDPPQTVQLTTTINSPSVFIVSIFTNYDLAKPPSDSFVEMFRVALGGGELRWYLDEEKIVCSSNRRGL
ncbi:hypothetical protein B0H21DRAFT_148862 [Amylocystis lapponica]|nr:hypothetical protein B0H21DRAFT_148862 [Amylocystis lapponica]